MICIDYASFKGVNTFSANHEVHVSSRFEHDGYRVWNSSEVWVLFRVLGVIFCDGERLVPGPWRAILWRWASCSGSLAWYSVTVSVLFRVLGVIFCDGERLVPGPWRDILWRWASCSGSLAWYSVTVSVLHRVIFHPRSKLTTACTNGLQKRVKSQMI